MEVQQASDKVKELIQKLFNLSEYNTSEEEATSALERARELLLKYELEEDAVRQHQATASVIQPHAGGFSAPVDKIVPSWVRNLAQVISDYFDVKTYREVNFEGWTSNRKRKVKATSFVFYGPKLAAETASYAFESVFNQVYFLSYKFEPDQEEYSRTYDEGWHDYTWKGWHQRAKVEYREGLVNGFNRKLDKIKIKEKEEGKEKQTTALTVRNHEIADAWLVSEGTTLIVKKYSDTAGNTGGGAYSDGIEDSGHITLIEKGIKE